MKEFTYEPSKQERMEEDDDDYDDADNFVEDEARVYGRENVGPVASPYLIPYVYKRRFLDTQYGVRKDGDMFMIAKCCFICNTNLSLSCHHSLQGVCCSIISAGQ